MHWPGASVALVFGYLISLFAGAFLLIHKLRENKEKVVEDVKSKSDNILDA
tara:strand:+ start:24764 stop:24916 length:153 start_codon:yes stop_codon:yes gene_type:complete